MPKCGGAPDTLAEDVLVGELTIDDEYVYWVVQPDGAHDGALKRVGKSGGAATELAHVPEEMRGIAVDANSLFVEEDAFPSRFAKVGGAVDAFRSAPGELAIDAMYVYSAAGPARVSKSSLQPSRLVDGMQSQPVTCIVVDDDAVYWTNNPGPLTKRSKTGGAAAKLTTSAHQGCLAVDDTDVYWTQDQDASAGVYRVSKIGGSATRLWSGPGVVRVALDQNTVYWAAGSGIWRARK
jgi:hypothetical protein